jgi:hypothetical protein
VRSISSSGISTAICCCSPDRRSSVAFDAGKYLSTRHARDKLGHDEVISIRQIAEMIFRRLAQAVAAQAVLALDRHRQSRGFRGTPAISAGITGEFGPATGTGEATRLVCPIVHDGSLRKLDPIFMPGSSRTAV